MANRGGSALCNWSSRVSVKCSESELVPAVVPDLPASTCPTGVQPAMGFAGVEAAGEEETLRHILVAPRGRAPAAIWRGWLQVSVTLSPLRTARRSRIACDGWVGGRPPRTPPGTPAEANMAETSNNNIVFDFTWFSNLVIEKASRPIEAAGGANLHPSANPDDIFHKATIPKDVSRDRRWL